MSRIPDINMLDAANFRSSCCSNNGNNDGELDSQEIKNILLDILSEIKDLNERKVK